MTIGAYILGCEGVSLSAQEVSFFERVNPWGLILFKRNVQSRPQLQALTSHFREITGRPNAPVLIDQEGGRVQRMGPPDWEKYPSTAKYSILYDADPLKALKYARLLGRLMAKDLFEVGINVDCLPVLDVPQPGSHEIIGDRAYGVTPERVSVLARAAVTGLMEGGVLGIIKHIPGHGRAMADSHKALPVVDTRLHELEHVDFLPFAALADIPMAMTAHVVYTALDPANPATMSFTIINDLIRRRFGYEGLIMTDDLSMHALSGDFSSRAAGAIAAGCDVALHCNGVLAEAEAVVEGAGLLEGQGLARAERAMTRCCLPLPFDEQEARAALNELMNISA
jgi:beta-N-acetylhexosaminidase